jgi:hypothetical protein
MPIFTRRAVQLMLDELAPWLTTAKAKDLVHRLDHVEPDQVIPTEYELALTWAVSKVADLEMEKPVGAKAPDLFSADLFPSGPAHIEIAAVSDVALSGEVVMRRAANIITSFANTVVKRAGRHLHFEFQEESGYIPPPPSKRGFFSLTSKSRYFRRRKITNKFALTDKMKTDIAAWIKGPMPRAPMRLTDPEIDVVVEWREREVHPHGNVFSRMPSEAHDLRDNPVWKVLKDKERGQLSGVPEGTRRMIFLCDAGCSLLRHVKPIMRHHTTVSGEQVIHAFLDEASIDGVCVFTPRHRSSNPFERFNNPIIWWVYVFDHRDGITDAEYAKVAAVKDLLPRAHLESYQARSWHQQSMFDPQGRGQYVPPQWRSIRLGVERVRVSARAVLEFLAGRLTREQFKDFAAADLFEQTLRQGLTISGVTLEPSGADNDDDYLVFEFGSDPAAMPFREPEILAASETAPAKPKAGK